MCIRDRQWAAAQAQLPLWPGASAHPQPWLSCSFGDWQPEVNAIALAFSPGRGLPLMAVSLGGPSRFVTADALRQDGVPALQRMVRRLQQDIDRA